MSAPADLLEWATKNPLWAIGTLLGGLGLNVVLCFLASSPTMQAFIIPAAAIGGLVGYGWAASEFRGADRKHRAWRSLWFFLVAALCGLALVALYFIIEGTLASQNPRVGELRDTLVDYDLLANLWAAVAAGLTTLFFILGLCVLSPGLDSNTP